MEKSIFFGNGLNRLNKQNPAWSTVLDYLKAPSTFDSNMLPNTLIYDRIILEKRFINDDFLATENEIKKKLALLLESVNRVPFYLDLYDLPINNFLTTNYDDAFIHSLEERYTLEITNNSTEDLYSVRRQKEIRVNSGRIINLWQLHGAIDKPASIMLGLDHYCGYISKLDSYVKGKYEYSQKQKKIQEPSISDKILSNQYSGSSWVELFFNTDVHILGFTLDYVETDIWWIIDRRARMKKYNKLEGLISNKIYFYCSDIEQQKKQLLESFDVVVEIFPIDDTIPRPYDTHYSMLIQRIREHL